MLLLFVVECFCFDVVKFLFGDVIIIMFMLEDKLYILIKLLDIVIWYGFFGNGEIVYYFIDCIEDFVKNFEGNFDFNLVYWVVKYGNVKLMVLILFWRLEDVNIINKKKEILLYLVIFNG